VVATTDRVAVDAGDDRLEEVLEAGVRVHRHLLALALHLLEPAHVAAGAERLVAGAGDDDDAHLRVGVGVVHRSPVNEFIESGRLIVSQAAPRTRWCFS